MNRDELIEQVAQGIAHMEGFYSEKANLSQRNCNPGNIRTWASKSNEPYPRFKGFVDFSAWAGGNQAAGLAEGWRVLRKLVAAYIDGRYHEGKAPSLYEMFQKYAPASDGNDPKHYAEEVAKRLGADPAVPAARLIAV